MLLLELFLFFSFALNSFTFYFLLYFILSETVNKSPSRDCSSSPITRATRSEALRSEDPC